jgi:hypothetical protein
VTKPKGKKLALVQSWVPESLKDWATRQAGKRGLTLAAWIRLLLIEMKESR